MSWNSQIIVTVLSAAPGFGVEDCGFESGAFETAQDLVLHTWGMPHKKSVP